MPLVEGEYMKKYDIIFAGWGASTCVLLIEMANQNLLENKSIVIIDPGSKVENDKTFCFWAQPSDCLYLDYASIISHEWSSIKINNDAPQAIAPLIYCHINSSDLYKLCREVMDKYSIEHLQESIESTSFDKSMEVATSESIFSCEWLFDARPPAQKRFNKRFSMYQSFLGFKVALKNQKFDSEVYHMMDFRVDQKESTQFVYLLPYDNQHALVELTRFGKKLIEKEEAKKILDEYIFENYGEYEVLDVEKGVIPMATISSKKNVKKRYVEIGTRGGM
jgi:lycopene beta-cyclase